MEEDGISWKRGSRDPSVAEDVVRPRRRTGSERWLGLLMSAVVLAGQSWSGPTVAGQTEPPIFGEEIEVRVINLEVKVTDRKGQHLPGLSARDFRLEVDGQTVPIGYFSEIRERRAVAGHPLASAESAEEGAVTAAGEAIPSVPPGERVPTSFLVFVDNVFGFPHDRELVLKAMRETVGALGPEDQMAIVSYDGRRLVRIGDWASSPEVLQDALELALTAPALGLQRLGEVNILDRQRVQLQELDSTSGRDSAATEESYIRNLSSRVEGALQAATSTLRGFADPPGRKVMLLTSGGWPRDPSIYAVGLDPAIRSRTRHFFPTAAFDELVNTANLLGYTLYPIDVPGNKVGVRGGNAASRVSQFVDAAPNSASEVLNGGFGFDRATDREIENESTLIELAKRTGGRALINSGRLAVIEEVVADTASYYWLGFTRDRQRDDQEHEIKVVVSRQGAKVRSRRSFRDLSPRDEVTMQIESALLFESEVDKELLQVELGKPKVRRRVRQPVTLRVPLDYIIMLPTVNGYACQLELRAAAIDETGARSPLPSVPVRIGGPTLPTAGQVAVVEAELQLSNVKQKLVLALHDLAGGAVLKASVDYQPPESSK